MRYCRVNDFLLGNILSEVYDRVSVVFEQRLYDVLADVVNVALYRSKHDLAFAYPVLAAHCRFYSCKACLCGIGGEYELRQEYLVLAEIVARAVKCGNEFVVDDVH